MPKPENTMVGTWDVDYKIKKEAGSKKLRASHQKTGQGCFVKATAGIPEMPDEQFDKISDVLEKIVSEVNGLDATDAKNHVAFLRKTAGYCTQLADMIEPSTPPAEQE